MYHEAPESAVDAIRILHSRGLLREEEPAFLIPTVRFRNRVVPGYLTVDPEELRGILRNHLADFAAWEEVVRRSLELP